MKESFQSQKARSSPSINEALLSTLLVSSLDIAFFAIKGPNLKYSAANAISKSSHACEGHSLLVPDPPQCCLSKTRQKD